MNGERLIRKSRATWNGNTLLISTDTALPDGQTYLSNILRWSLDADGMLVIGDTEICGRGECPSVLTTVKLQEGRLRAERLQGRIPFAFLPSAFLPSAFLPSAFCLLRSAFSLDSYQFSATC